MGRKRHKPEEIVAKLRQVDVLTTQDKTVAGHPVDRRHGTYPKGIFGCPMGGSLGEHFLTHCARRRFAPCPRR